MTIFSCSKNTKMTPSNIRWEVVDTRKFTKEETDKVASAEVVPSQYGKSVKFSLVGGGCVYIPVSSNSVIAIGQVVDLNTANILTLSKPGEASIERIECLQK